MKYLVSLLGANLSSALSATLSPNEQPTIRQIEDRCYAQLPLSGLGFIAANDLRVIAIQVHAEAYKDFKNLAANLPEEVSFATSRRAMQNLLGNPSASSGGPPFVGMWDRFDRGEYSIHVQYADDEASIKFMTIVVAETIPSPTKR